jgi:hypothetical protein
MTFPAPFALLLRERLVCVSLIVAGCGLVISNMLGLKFQGCGFKTFTGLPCPGCGMTSSVAALSRGQWDSGVAYHPFGPMVLVGALLLIMLTCLPQASRIKIVPWIAQSERRTGWSSIIILWFMAHGLYRMGLVVISVAKDHL